MSKEYLISESQLRNLVESMKQETKEGSDGNYMAKQQLFTIATAAYKMWENLEEGEELEDWMTSKLAQTEQNLVSVFKAFMYDEFENKMGRDV
jgi:hypothetical protein